MRPETRKVFVVSDEYGQQSLAVVPWPQETPGTLAGLCLRVAVVVVLLATTLALVGCDVPPSAPIPERSHPDFVVLHNSSVSSWGMYVVMHRPTGMCYVAADPPGEGGGSLTATDPAVCRHYTRLEASPAVGEDAVCDELQAIAVIFGTTAPCHAQRRKQGGSRP